MPVPELARVVAAVDMLRPLAGADAHVAAYRLLRVELGRQRGVQIAVDADLDDALVDGVLAMLLVEGSQSDDVRELAELHQRLLVPASRKAAGAWFTPQTLVEHLLDQSLEPALDEAACPAEVSVLDPACGSGLFLVAALHRFVRRGVSPDHALRHCLSGVELDPAAAELARISLWLAALDAGGGAALPEAHVEVGDALVAERSAAYDVVVGNPPFLNRMERRTALEPAVGRRLATLSQGAVRGYTDVSAVFLHRAVSWVPPGGRVALVQPQSLLAARDASGVRAHVADTCALESLWASAEPVFDAGVLTCAPVLRKGAGQGPVRRFDGPTCRPVPAAEPADLRGTWSHLVADALGVPRVRPRGARPTGGQGTIGDVADCTADFRDQYYGLEPHVREAAECPDGAPLVTTGLIEPAQCRWGASPTRFLKRRWAAPVIDLTSLADASGLARWARARLVPKVLVGTQGRIVEAVVDERGEWLPSVPTITVVPHGTSLWHLLAVLSAPSVAAHAAATYAGSGLTMRSIKLSARQVAALPLPVDDTVWAEGADRARRAQHDPADRVVHLEQMGSLMCRAYDVAPDEVLPWWRDRLR